MNKIVNLTQHSASAEQVRAGVIPCPDQEALRGFLTFNNLEEARDWKIVGRSACGLAQLAAQSGCRSAMIGGAPYLMRALENALTTRGITPLYAFSRRESIETVQADGSVRKSSIFKHLGFIEV